MSAEQVVAVILSVFASTGFWSFLQSRFQKRDKEHESGDAETQMIKGLGHDRICHLCENYLARGYVTKDEYENLHDYLFVPYKTLNGNGTAERLMKEVEKLSIKERGKMHD